MSRDWQYLRRENRPDTSTSSWRIAKDLYTYLVQKSGIVENEISITSIDEISGIITSIVNPVKMLGDIMLFEYDKPDDPTRRMYHIVLVSGIRDGMILYTGQNIDIIDNPLSSFFDRFAENNPVVRYLHIEDN